MQINLLSLFSGGGEAAPPAVDRNEAKSPLDRTLPDTAKHNKDEAHFDKLFEEKLSSLTPEEIEETPAPKLMAAFIQRLSNVPAEAEEAPAAVEKLSDEQLTAISDVLGIDISTLELNAAISAEQILPQATADQQQAISQLVAVLKELADLGQQMHQQGLSLVEVPNPTLAEVGQGETLSTASVLTLLANDSEIEQVQPLELSEETLAALAELFQLPMEELRQNIAQIHLVDLQQIDTLTFEGMAIIDMNTFSNDLEEQATAPGLVQLIASVLNKPVEEVWQQMEALTGDESEIPLGLVLASVIKPFTAQKTSDAEFDFNQAIARNGDKIAPLPLTPNSNFGDVPELAGRKVLADIDLPDITLPANAAEAAKASPLKFVAQQTTVTTTAENVQAASLAAAAQPANGKKAENEPAGLNLARIVLNKNGAAPAERANQVSAAVRNGLPLLNESAERSLIRPSAAEAASSLALSASDSKLDFESRLNEVRNFNNRQAGNPNHVREQVLVQVKQGIARGDTHISVRLSPAELGRVDVRVEVNADGRTTIAVVADSRDTLDLLQRDSRSLEKAFADMGMEMSDSGMSFDLNEQFTGDQQEDSSQETTKTAESSFDAMLNDPDELIAEALLDGGSLSYTVGVDDGLNIKV